MSGIFLIVFFALFIKEKRSHLLGFLFVSSLSYLHAFLIVTNEQNTNLSLSIVHYLLWGLIYIPALIFILMRLFSAVLLLLKKKLRWTTIVVNLFNLAVLILFFGRLDFWEPWVLRFGKTVSTPLSAEAGIRAYLAFLPVLYLMSFSAYIYASFFCQIHFKRPDLEYILVLGSGFNPETMEPDKNTAKRVERAVKLQKEYPEIEIIFSGGLGDESKPSEALVMKDYAVSLGLADERWILEEEARNTIENIKLSEKLMQFINARFAIVSNHYHVLRGSIIAREMKFTSYAYGVSSGNMSWCSNFADEFFWSYRTSAKDSMVIFIIGMLLFAIELLVHV